MEDIKLKALGMEGVGQEPTTVEEFDGIAKKVGSCIERARQYIRYHVTLGEVREAFLHGIPAKDATATSPAVEELEGVEKLSGVERKTKPILDKDGKPKMDGSNPLTDWAETEGDYYKRVCATLVQEQKFTTVEGARASFQPTFDAAIKAVGFPAEKSESAARGPIKLPAKYKIFAAKKLATGTVDALMATITAAIQKTFTPATAPTDGTPVKMYTGEFPTGTKDAAGKDVMQAFSVPDVDAEALGKVVKEYQDWKTQQDLLS